MIYCSHGNVDLNFALATFIGILAIVNPMGAVSNYVALTEGYERREKRAAVKKAVIVGAIVLLVFAFMGRFIFEFFSITVDGFKVAGGVVLFMIAMDMVRGMTSPSKLTEKEKIDSMDREQIGIIPLGIPLLAGPGSISTVMITMSASGQPILFTTMVVVISIAVVMAISYLILRQSDRIFIKIGRAGTKAISRIMGLILATIAIQFIASGIIGLFNITV